MDVSITNFSLIIGGRNRDSLVIQILSPAPYETLLPKWANFTIMDDDTRSTDNSTPHAIHCNRGDPYFPSGCRWCEHK